MPFTPRLARYLICGAGLVAGAIAACGGTMPRGGPGPGGAFDGGGTVAEGGFTTFDATADVGSILVPFDAAPPCVGLQCQQVACPGGATTSVSGTVYAPNGTLPLYNVIVYVPNAPLDPVAQGITCDQCGTIQSGSPLVTTLSDSTGKFVLDNVPVGTNVPLVVQLGKWRRQTTIPTVTACTNNALKDPNLTRLPKNQKEGSMPHIALTTGECDSLGCMLGKLGIDPAEFGVQSDGYNKAINVYSSPGDLSFSDGLSNTTQANGLWTNLALLKTYDMGIFSCECSEAQTTKGTFGNATFQTVTNYLDQGGRIFTTDFQYTWYKFSPDPQMGVTSATSNTSGLGEIPGNAPSGDNPLLLSETFPKGLALAQWLSTVFPTNPLVLPDGGAQPDSGTNGVSCDTVFDNISSLTAKPQLWATSNSSGNGKPGIYDPRVFTVNTPVGVPIAQQCGKGVHIDAHITEATQGSTDFVGCNGASGPVGSAGCYPLTCTNPLKEDEAMFAFFFFDLASCIQNEGLPPVPPPPPPPK